MYTIYQIINTINGKIYTGFTTKQPPEKRFLDHKKAARNFSPYHIHRAIRKENPDAFVFVIKEQGEDDDYGLNMQEPKYIAEIPKNLRYNMTPGGEGSCGWKPGRTPSQEHRANISAALKMSLRAQSARAKLHAEQTGKKRGTYKKRKSYDS